MGVSTSCPSNNEADVAANSMSSYIPCKGKRQHFEIAVDELSSSLEPDDEMGVLIPVKKRHPEVAKLDSVSTEDGQQPTQSDMVKQNSDASLFDYLVDDVLQAFIHRLGFHDICTLMQCRNKSLTARISFLCLSIHLPYNFMGDSAQRVGSARALIKQLVNLRTLTSDIDRSQFPRHVWYGPFGIIDCIAECKNLRILRIPTLWLSPRHNGTRQLDLKLYPHLTDLAITQPLVLSPTDWHYSYPANLTSLQVAEPVDFEYFTEHLPIHCPKLRELKIHLHSELRNPQIITKFSDLQSLQILYQDTLSDTKMRSIANLCPNLTTLRITASFDNWSRVNLIWDTTFDLSMNSDQAVDFSFFSNVTTFEIPWHGVEQFPPLTTHLSINGCGSPIPKFPPHVQTIVCFRYGGAIVAQRRKPDEWNVRDLIKETPLSVSRILFATIHPSTSDEKLVYARASLVDMNNPKGDWFYETQLPMAQITGCYNARSHRAIIQMETKADAVKLEENPETPLAELVTTTACPFALANRPSHVCRELLLSRAAHQLEILPHHRAWLNPACGSPGKAEQTQIHGLDIAVAVTEVTAEHPRNRSLFKGCPTFWVRSYHYMNYLKSLCSLTTYNACWLTVMKASLESWREAILEDCNPGFESQMSIYETVEVMAGGPDAPEMKPILMADTIQISNSYRITCIVLAILLLNYCDLFETTNWKSIGRFSIIANDIMHRCHNNLFRRCTEFLLYLPDHLMRASAEAVFYGRTNAHIARVITILDKYENGTYDASTAYNCMYNLRDDAGQCLVDPLEAY